MSPLNEKKAIKVMAIFSIIWVIICALFSLCGKEYFWACFACALIVVGFAWLCIPIWELDYRKYLKQIESKRQAEERAKHEAKTPKAPVWPIIKRILGFIACAIIVLIVIGCISSGINAFVDSYGMVAFLLLLILLVMVLG